MQYSHGVPIRRLNSTLRGKAETSKLESAILEKIKANGNIKGPGLAP